MKIEIEKKYNFTFTQAEYELITDLLLLARDVIEYASFEDTNLQECRNKSCDIIDNFNSYISSRSEKSFFCEDKILILASKNITSRVNIYGGL